MPVGSSLQDFAPSTTRNKSSNYSELKVGYVNPVYEPGKGGNKSAAIPKNRTSTPLLVLRSVQRKRFFLKFMDSKTLMVGCGSNCRELANSLESPDLFPKKGCQANHGGICLCNSKRNHDVFYCHGSLPSNKPCWQQWFRLSIQIESLFVKVSLYTTGKGAGIVGRKAYSTSSQLVSNIMAVQN